MEGSSSARKSIALDTRLVVIWEFVLLVLSVSCLTYLFIDPVVFGFVI